PALRILLVVRFEVFDISDIFYQLHKRCVWLAIRAQAIFVTELYEPLDAVLLLRRHIRERSFERLYPGCLVLLFYDAERFCPEATFRRIDDSVEGYPVFYISEKPEIGDHILDFSPVKEFKAADQLAGYAVFEERLFKPSA